MGVMKEIFTTIEDLIEEGFPESEIISYIMEQYTDLDYDTVAELVEKVDIELAIRYKDLEYDDSMDGDAESALASIGWGTDEDYGYASDDY